MRVTDKYRIFTAKDPKEVKLRRQLAEARMANDREYIDKYHQELKKYAK